MIIKNLIVRKIKPSEEVIRNIKFNEKGLSLIIDDTPEELIETGNSVGKTTAIKIIDLCLGASSVNKLYIDSTDTNSENTEVKDFLKKYKVQAELIVVNKGRKYSIKRDLYNNGKRYIDDKKYTRDEFTEKLNHIIFDQEEEKPTFRQLMKKFIRLGNTSEESMIKFLPMTTSKPTYDSIYCFLFGLYEKEFISKKTIILDKIKNCNSVIDTLEKSKKIMSRSMLDQKLEMVDAELCILYKNREELSYMEEYRAELDEKRNITVSINNLQNEMEMIEFEISSIENSINELEKEKSNVDLGVLKNIYNEAKHYMPELQKKYEEMVGFHNTMIQNRIDFIKEQLKIKQQDKADCSKKMSDALENKKNIVTEVLDEGLLDELNSLNKKIEELTYTKGEIQQSIEIYDEQESIIKELNDDLEELDELMKDNEVQEKIKKFNRIFSDYCDKLYGEKYFIVYDENWGKEKGGFPITIGSLGGNVGTGKKKAVIVAFDLAYMKYSIEEGIQAPKFVIHDKMESTHINQLKTIFELCSEIEGQYIMPILRERIDKVDEDIIEKAKVLELSTEDRFFKI